MPEVPTPAVNGQVVGSPALHASTSISSLAPAARMLGLLASTASPGSFCLFCANVVGGLELVTSDSVWAATGSEVPRRARAAANGAMCDAMCQWAMTGYGTSPQA